MSELRIPRPRAEIVAWTDTRAVPHHAAVWHAWLHGRVGVLASEGHDVLVVPMGDLPLSAQRFAERLYTLGATVRLG